MAARHRLEAGQEPVAAESRSLARRQLLVHALSAPSPRRATSKAMDVSLILYAEHEYNASTFAARVHRLDARRLALGHHRRDRRFKGPLHGGANENVMDVLRSSRHDGECRAVDSRRAGPQGKDHGLWPPRLQRRRPAGRVSEGTLRDLADETGNEDMEAMADVIETRSSGRKRSCRRTSIGPPAGCTTTWTCRSISTRRCSSLSRVSGWSAHVIEQLDNNRLIRPRARYTGPERRPWLPLAER